MKRWCRGIPRHRGRHASDLEGHPTPRLPFVDVATGSLGQGICAGIGLALSARRIASAYRTYVLLGDGESAEGSVWEAAQAGRLVIRGRLTPEVGAVVRRALEAAADRLHREDPDRVETTSGQRRADALGLVAESALAANLDPGTAGDRYQVVVHVEAGALANDAQAGQSALEEPEGLHVSAETSRRLACDAALVVMRHGADGRVLDVGRRRRTVPPALRRALAARDPRCRFPGCQAPHCDAHHVRHWADGGRTKLDNLVRLCRFHHRAVHEEGFTVTLDAHGEAHVVRPDGRPLPAAPPPLRWAGPPLAPTAARLAAHGLTIDAHTATPSGYGDRLELAWAIDVLWRPAVDAPSAMGTLGASDVSADTPHSVLL